MTTPRLLTLARMAFFGIVSVIPAFYGARCKPSLFLWYFISNIICLAAHSFSHLDLLEENKKQAMNAAAAKALDCFSRRECHGKENALLSQQRCHDAAYLSEEDACAIPIPPDGIDLPTIHIVPGGDLLSSE